VVVVVVRRGICDPFGVRIGPGSGEPLVGVVVFAVRGGLICGVRIGPGSGEPLVGAGVFAVRGGLICGVRIWARGAVSRSSGLAWSSGEA
jgi:hypothetical protein